MLEAKAVRGVPWTILSYAANRVLFLATTITLARLLVPSDFGVLALALIAVGLVSLLSGLGLGGALVVRQELDRRAQGTILTILVVTGAVFALLLAAAAPLASRVFGEPRLTNVLVALSVVVLLSGFNWFYETLLQRELEFRRRFAAIMVQTVVSSVLAIVLALLGAGIWSLVAGQIGGAIAYGIGLIALAPYRVVPSFDRAVARDVVGTGIGFVLQGGTAFVSQNADYFVVGRVLGPGPLGVYFMACRLSEVPYWALVDPIAKVTFPGFARMAHRGEDVAGSFLATLRVAALAACPLGVLLSATADPLTRLIFGDKWLAMIGPLSLLGLWSAVRTVGGTSGWLLNSVGHANLLAVLSTLFLIPLVGSLLLGAVLGGITAVAAVVLANAVLAMLVVSFFVGRRVGASMRSQWRALRPVAIACAVAWAAAAGTVELTSGEPPLFSLLVSIAGGVVAYLGALFVVEPSLLAHTREQLRGLLRDGSPVPDPR
jgi:O-antigen/teichoic acid export membrane protein